MTYRITNADDSYTRESDNRFDSESDAQESVDHLTELYPDVDFGIEEVVR